MRIALAMVAAGLALFLPAQVATIAPIVLGALGGLVLLRSGGEANLEAVQLPVSKRGGVVAGAVFLLLLVMLPMLARVFAVPELDVFSAFYQTGALVFGGGHVVLPLLESAVVGRGWVVQQTFLAGYGAAQALPGPLFTFGAYLGASIRPSANPLLYGLISLIGIFAPGLLAMAAVLPFWSAVRGYRSLQFALKGVNASVVGILIAALFRPLWTSTILHASDFWIALAAFVLLTVWKVQPWRVVVGVAVVSMFVSLAF
jgi:chromate transporter